MNLTDLYNPNPLTLDPTIQPIEKTFTQAMASRPDHLHFINTTLFQRLKCTHCRGTVSLPIHTDPQIVAWISSHSACRAPGSLSYKVSDDPFFSSIIRANSARKVSLPKPSIPPQSLLPY